MKRLENGMLTLSAASGTKQSDILVLFVHADIDGTARKFANLATSSKSRGDII